ADVADVEVEGEQPVEVVEVCAVNPKADGSLVVAVTEECGEVAEVDAAGETVEGAQCVEGVKVWDTAEGGERACFAFLVGCGVGPPLAHRAHRWPSSRMGPSRTTTGRRSVDRKSTRLNSSPVKN